MSLRPRIAERLLEAIGADTEFRDGVLGDLREEHAIRAAWDGEDEAARWYRREALRTAPHLLRDRIRSLRVRDLGGLLGRAVTAQVFVAVASVVVFLVLRIAVAPEGFGPSRPRSAGFLIALRLFSLLGAVGGGWIAAWLDDRRPLAAATTYAALGLFGGLAQLALAGRGLDWMHALVMIVMLAAPLTGGVLRVVQTARREREGAALAG